jgi:hypothetical protein
VPRKHCNLPVIGLTRRNRFSFPPDMTWLPRHFGLEMLTSPSFPLLIITRRLAAGSLMDRASSKGKNRKVTNHSSYWTAV